MGKWNHGRLQAMLTAGLIGNERRWRYRTETEVRLHIAPGRYRIPDIMVVSQDSPLEQLAQTPPLVCAEILSPDDTFTSIWDRIAAT